MILLPVPSIHRSKVYRFMYILNCEGSSRQPKRATCYAIYLASLQRNDNRGNDLVGKLVHSLVESIGYR